MPMAEPRRVPPPCGGADPLTRDTRPAALAALIDNDGTEALPAVGSRRRPTITLLEADA